MTAKMRLGLTDTALAVDCALALEAGGADVLVNLTNDGWFLQTGGPAASRSTI